MVVLTIPFAAPPVANNTPPSLVDISDVTVNAGQTVAFTASATDTDSPPQTLTFILVAGVTNAMFNTNSARSHGVRSSRGGFHKHVTLVVTDSGSPNMSATQSFPSSSIRLRRRPSATSSFPADNSPSVSAVRAARITPSRHPRTIMQWSLVFNTSSPAVPFVWTDTNSPAVPQRFYRVKLDPPLP